MADLDIDDLQNSIDDLRSSFERLYSATGQQSEASKNVFKDLTIEDSLRRSHNQALAEAKKTQAAREAGEQKLIKAAKDFGVGMFTATNQMYTSSEAFGAVTPVIEAMTTTTKSLVEAFGMLFSGVSVLGFSAGRVSESLAKFASTGIDVVSTAVQQQIRNTQTLINNLNSMSKVGVTFGGSMVAMQKAAASGGISVDTFAKFVSKNVGILANLGGSAELGAVKIATLGKEIGRQNNQLLAMYGGYEQINEGIAQYADTLVGYGISGTRLNKELEAGARSYLYQQKELAELTGKSVEQLKKEEEDRQRVAAYQNVMATKSAEEQANIRMAMAIAEKTSGERGTKYLMESVITNGNVISKSGIEFQAMAGPLANTFEQLRKSANTSTEAYKTQAADIVKNNAATNQAWARSNQTTTFSTLQFAGYQNDIFSMVNDVAAAVNKSAKWQTELTEADIQQQENRKKGARGEANELAGAIDSLEAFKVKMDEVTITHLANTSKYLTLAYKAADYLTASLDKTNDAVDLLTKIITGSVTEADVQRFKDVMGFSKKEEQTNPVASNPTYTTGKSGIERAKETSAADNPNKQKIVIDNLMAAGWTKETAEKYARQLFPTTETPAPLEKKADGGIVNKPVIAGEAGPEAIVPLPNGRSIPVDMDLRPLVEALQDLLEVNKDNRDYLEKLFHASV